ncbi:LIC12162 family protein [bacterium]|nr:LIC12162 family protein [bacterium]
MTVVVTTPVKIETLAQLSKPLFLGFWCRNMGALTEAQSKSVSAIPVLAHPWEDSERRNKDFASFDAEYEKCLSHLADALNKIHGTSKSTRYWRILVGPWLDLLGFMYFEKFILFQHAVLTIGHDLEVLDFDGVIEPLEDMHAFKDIFLSPRFVSRVSAEIAEAMGISVKYLDNSPDSKPPIGSLRPVKNSTARIGQLKLGNVRSRDAVLYQTFMRPSSDISWQLHLRQMPRLWSFPRLRMVSQQLWVDFREVRTDGSTSGEFQELFFALAKKNMPTAYLENYQLSLAKLSDLKLPESPRFIFTSNAYNKNDSFKLYSAEKTERGVPLLVAQHGGSFGVGLHNSHENHIKKTADAFMTWGWTDGETTFPSSMIKAGRPLRPTLSGRILLVGFVNPMFVYDRSSMPLGESGWQEYWEDQKAFVNALPTEIRDRITVRLYPGDHGRNQIELWRNFDSRIALELPSVPIRKSLSRSALAILTYDSTTYLECLQTGFPFLSFWRKDHFPQRVSAAPFMDGLRQVGVHHDSAISAAKTLTRDFHNLEAYYERFDSPQVMEFKKQFANDDRPVRHYVSDFLRRYGS